MFHPGRYTFLTSKNFPMQQKSATFWHETWNHFCSPESDEAGVDIVPVYGLGHTQLFSMLDKSSSLGGFLMKMSRRLKVCFRKNGGVARSEKRIGPWVWEVDFQRQFEASRFPLFPQQFRTMFGDWWTLTIFFNSLLQTFDISQSSKLIYL